jgi:hypothetical protein
MWGEMIIANSGLFWHGCVTIAVKVEELILPNFAQKSHGGIKLYLLQRKLLYLI